MVRKPDIQYVGQFYVYGSEAKQLAQQTEKKKARTRLPLERLQNIQKVYVDPVALVGMVVGGLSQYALSQSLPGCMLCSAGVLLLLDGLRVGRGLLTQSAQLPQLLQVAVPECLLSLACTPLIYLLFRTIFNRVGGTKLA